MTSVGVAEYRLLVLSSEYIVGYLTENPLVEETWSREYKALAGIGGPGDKAGMPPKASMGCFLELLDRRHGALFTQQEFFEACCHDWEEADPGWLFLATDEQFEGLQAKAFRNFYPSGIDTIHFWALCAELGQFDRARYSLRHDVVGHEDLRLYSGDRAVKIALHPASRAARNAAAYKVNYRGDTGNNTMHVELPLDRPRSPGNKRWYRQGDIIPLLSPRLGEW